MTHPQGEAGSRSDSAGLPGAPADLSEHFSLVSGGAFHALLGRLGLLESDGLPGAKAASALALMTWLAEGLILVVAVIWSSLNTRFIVTVSHSSWESVAVDGISQLSWAGTVSVLTSNTLFLFLVLRWFWRFGVWAALLRHIAQLELQLMPLHPDRAGGLGFLALFPSIFTGLVFALGCVISGAMIKALELANFSEQTIGLAVAAWLSFVLLVFLGPLLFFVSPLHDARERGLLEYGRLAHLHHLDFHRKWIERDDLDENILGSADPSSVSDLNASVETVLNMRLVPIDKMVVVQLLLAACIPLIAVVLYLTPLAQLLLWIVGVVL